MALAVHQDTVAASFEHHQQAADVPCVRVFAREGGVGGDVGRVIQQVKHETLELLPGQLDHLYHPEGDGVALALVSAQCAHGWGLIGKVDRCDGIPPFLKQGVMY